MPESLLAKAFETTIIVVQGTSQEEIKLLVQQEANCYQALEHWLAGRIDVETFADILEANGHTMDVTLQTFDDNLDYLGV